MYYRTYACVFVCVLVSVCLQASKVGDIAWRRITVISQAEEGRGGR